MENFDTVVRYNFAFSMIHNDLKIYRECANPQTWTVIPIDKYVDSIESMILFHVVFKNATIMSHDGSTVSIHTCWWMMLMSCWRPNIFSRSYNISPPQLREHNVKQETTLKPKETIFNGTYLYCGFVVCRRRFAWMKLEYTRFSTMLETAVTVLNWNEQHCVAGHWIVYY